MALDEWARMLCFCPMSMLFLVEKVYLYVWEGLFVLMIVSGFLTSRIAAKSYV